MPDSWTRPGFAPGGFVTCVEATHAGRSNAIVRCRGRRSNGSGDVNDGDRIEHEEEQAKEGRKEPPHLSATDQIHTDLPFLRGLGVLRGEGGSIPYGFLGDVVLLRPNDHMAPREPCRVHPPVSALPVLRATRELVVVRRASPDPDLDAVEAGVGPIRLARRRELLLLLFRT